MTGNPTKKVRTAINIALSIVLILLLLALCIYLMVYLLYRKTTIDPYEHFREIEFQSLPDFDNLNEQTFQALPGPPAGFKFLEKTSYGIEYQWHMGRWMMISLLGVESAEDEFFDYYGIRLLNDQWRLLQEGEFQLRFATYYKGTSCVELSVNQPRYFIRIWPDFEHQSFVSETPNADILGRVLYDSWIIATCP